MPCNICGQPKSLEEFLASLIKKDSNGNYGIVINQITIQSCEDLVNAVSCGEPFDLEKLVKSSCTLDECDNPMLNVFVEAQG